MNTEDILRDPAIQKARERVARIGQMMFERRLTDAAGGNISERAGELVCISPRYSGSQRQWQLTPEDVLVVNFEGEVLVGAGTISRESKVHLRLASSTGGIGMAAAAKTSRLRAWAWITPVP